MGQYCTPAAVQSRLQSKVKFALAGDTDPNKMSTQLLNQLISEAESQLEIDLIDRYEVPFKNMSGGEFSTLPTNTLITIQNLAELVSVIRVLETDFGRGTSVNGDKYTQALQKRYDAVVEKLIKKKGETREWMVRPLDGLMVAYNNTGDNGFRGRVHNTSTVSHQADYATKQINSPGEDLFFTTLDALDHPDTNGSPGGGR